MDVESREGEHEQWAWEEAGKRGGGGESAACVFEGLRRTAELWDWRESMDVFRWMDDSVVVLVGPTCRLSCE
jgi:hypothetical protein